MSTRRLDRLVATFHRAHPRPLTNAERLAERINQMTTGERVARLRELTVKALELDAEANLDRPLNGEEREAIAVEAAAIEADRYAEVDDELATEDGEP